MIIINHRLRYMPLLIAIGLLLLTPMHYYAAEEPSSASIKAPTELKQKESTSTTTAATETPDSASCPSTMQKLTLKFKPLLNSLGNVNLSTGLGLAAAAASTAYLHDRSIVTAHEGAHAFTAIAGGYRGDLYISPKFWGGAWMSHNCPAGTPMHGLISLAGPLGGVMAYLAWLQIWNMAMRYWKSGNVKESFIKGKKDPLFNKDSSLLAIGGTFYGISYHYIRNMLPGTYIRSATYGELAGSVGGNDAVDIQNALANIAPFLAKAYPFLAYAGLAGLMGYGAYGLYATYKAKKEAGQPLW